MENDLRGSLLENRAEILMVSNITEMARAEVFYPGESEEVGACLGWQSNAVNICPHSMKPTGEPGALEARVSRQQDAFPFPEVVCRVPQWVQFQVFQGALPEAHSSSRRALSRSVSMGCQNP